MTIRTNFPDLAVAAKTDLSPTCSGALLAPCSLGRVVWDWDGKQAENKWASKGRLADGWEGKKEAGWA